MNKTDHNSSTDTSGRLAQLLQYAESYSLSQHYALARQLAGVLQGADLGEMLLSQAQLKLLTANETVLADLEKANALLKDGSRFAPFLSYFRPLDPNAFIVFNPAIGFLNKFLSALRQSYGLLRTFCGPAGENTGRQIEAEILYFMGQPAEAAAITRQVHAASAHGGMAGMAIMARYTLLRCHLAMGDAQGAHKVLLDIIQSAKADTSCAQMYGTIRSWVNLTTGWSGDTPRYHTTPAGAVHAILEDRVEAVQEGIADLGPTEAPLVEYARLNNPSSCTVRNYYMDIYHAMVYYKYDEHERFSKTFSRIYATAQGSGLIMPIIEYGGQIVPMLQYALSGGEDGQYSGDWFDRIIFFAEKYEETLRAFRED